MIIHACPCMRMPSTENELLFSYFVRNKQQSARRLCKLAFDYIAKVIAERAVNFDEQYSYFTTESLKLCQIKLLSPCV